MPFTTTCFRTPLFRNFPTRTLPCRRLSTSVPLQTFIKPTTSKHIFKVVDPLDQGDGEGEGVWYGTHSADDELKVKDLRRSISYCPPESFPSATPPPLEWSIPEFSLLGRSNVGKSTLLSTALLKLTGLRKFDVKMKGPGTGKKPGKTKGVNYYGVWGNRGKEEEKVSNALYYLIDLPGYGFAGTVSESKRKSWDTTTRRYLESRCNPDYSVNKEGGMRTVFLLIDSRRGVGSKDLDVMDFLDSAMLSYTIVLTKVDALSTLGWLRVANDTAGVVAERNRGKFGWCRKEIIGVSGKKGFGVEDFIRRIEGWE